MDKTHRNLRISKNLKRSIKFLSGIYFDGKIDGSTLVRSEAGGNTHSRVDHYSVVLHYPDTRQAKQEGDYLGFFNPENGKGKLNLCRRIFIECVTT